MLERYSSVTMVVACYGFRVLSGRTGAGQSWIRWFGERVAVLGGDVHGLGSLVPARRVDANVVGPRLTGVARQREGGLPRLCSWSALVSRPGSVLAGQHEHRKLPPGLGLGCAEVG
jgi:hypothetical protein